jgi:perosamine synthetase
MAAHLEPAYAHGAGSPPALAPRALPVTERLTRHSLILPLYHELSEADQDHVVDTLRKLGS